MIFRLLIHFFTFDTVVLSKLSISFVLKKEKNILKRELFFPSISSQLEGTIIWTISLHQPSRSIAKRISYWLNCSLLGYGARSPICKRRAWPTKNKSVNNKKKWRLNLNKLTFMKYHEKNLKPTEKILIWIVLNVFSGKKQPISLRNSLNSLNSRKL